MVRASVTCLPQFADNLTQLMQQRKVIVKDMDMSSLGITFHVEMKQKTLIEFTEESSRFVVDNSTQYWEFRKVIESTDFSKEIEEIRKERDLPPQPNFPEVSIYSETSAKQ